MMAGAGRRARAGPGEADVQMDDDTLERLRILGPRKAYETVKHSVLRNPWGASSEDLRAALDQMVAAGIFTWDEVESFEGS